MARTKARAYWARVAGALLLAACGHESSSEPVETRWCEAACGAYSRCGGVSLDECQFECPASEYLLTVRDEVLERELECYSDKECPLSPDIRGEDECFLAVRAALGPTEESSTFCDLMATRFFACGWYTGIDDCAREYASFREPVLEQFANCEGEACDSLEECS